MGKIVRIVLYVLLVLVAVWIGWEVTSVINNLLSFQVTLYSYILNAQQAAGAVTDTIGSAWQQMRAVLGAEPEITAQSVPGMDMDESLKAYAQKIFRFSLLIGSIIGLIAYRIMSKLVFGMREHIRSISTFIK